MSAEILTQSLPGYGPYTPGDTLSQTYYRDWSPPKSRGQSIPENELTYDDYIQAMLVFQYAMTGEDWSAPQRRATTITNARGGYLGQAEFYKRMPRKRSGGGWGYNSSGNLETLEDGTQKAQWANPARDAINMAHFIKQNDSIQQYVKYWWTYNMSKEGSPARRDSGSRLNAMKSGVNPYNYLAYYADENTPAGAWKIQLKQQFEIAYHANDDTRSAIVKFFEDKLPGAVPGIGSVIGALTHIEQGIEGKETWDEVLLGVGDVAGADFHLQGEATAIRDTVDNANTVPGGLVAALFTPFSTVESNVIGKGIESVFEMTGAQEAINTFSNDLRAENPAVADMFNVAIKSMINPFNIIMVMGFYALAAPIEQYRMLGEDKGADYAEAFIKDLGFLEITDLSSTPPDIAREINGLILVFMMEGMGAAYRQGGEIKAKRAELKKEVDQFKGWVNEQILTNKSELVLKDGEVIYDLEDVPNEYVENADQILKSKLPTFEEWKTEVKPQLVYEATKAKVTKRFNLEGDEFDRLETDYTERNGGAKGTPAQLEKFAESFFKDELETRGGMRGVEVTQPGELLPEGWTRETNADGLPEYIPPEGFDRTPYGIGKTYTLDQQIAHMHGEPLPVNPPLTAAEMVKVKGYEQGNVLAPDASIAAFFARDAYRGGVELSSVRQMEAGGWYEETSGGSGRMTNKKTYEQFENTISETRQQRARLNDLRDLNKERVDELNNELSKIDDAAIESASARELEILKDFKNDVVKLEKDVTELDNKITEIDRDIQAFEDAGESIDPNIQSSGQEISEYYNADENAVVMSFRGNQHSWRDAGAITSFGVGLEELNPRMRSAIKSVIDSYERADNAGADFYLTGQSLGGATVLYINEWLGINRPDIVIKKAYTFNAGSSEFGRAGTRWDAFYDRHANDASQWQQRLTNYNVRGDPIAEQPTPYGRTEVYEPHASRLKGDRGTAEGKTKMDVLTNKGITRHSMEFFPIRGGEWWSYTDNADVIGRNRQASVNFYGLTTSTRTRVFIRTLKRGRGRPFLRPVDLHNNQWLQNVPGVTCADTGGFGILCQLSGPVPDLSELERYAAEAEAAEGVPVEPIRDPNVPDETASDYQTGGADAPEDERVRGGAPEGEAEHLEKTLGIKPTGTTLKVQGRSGTDYLCSFNSPGDCQPLQNVTATPGNFRSKRAPVEILGFSRMPAGPAAVWVLYNPATGVIVY